MDVEKIVSKIPSWLFVVATVILVLLLLTLFSTGKQLSLNPIGFIDPVPPDASMREKDEEKKELVNLENALKEAQLQNDKLVIELESSKSELRPIALGMSHLLSAYVFFERNETTDKIRTELDEAIGLFKSTSSVKQIDVLESTRAVLGKVDSGENRRKLDDAIKQIVGQLPDK